MYSLIWIFARAGRYRSVFRLGLGIAVIYATWMYMPALRTYSKLVGDSVRQAQQVNAQRQLPLIHPPPRPLLPLNATQQPLTAAKPHLSQTINGKLTAAGLESALQREPQFRPGSQLHCKRATRGWDYTCSYMPTPQLSATRLQFGARVDATRWIELSRVVPAGTIIPQPRTRAPGDTRP